MSRGSRRNFLKSSVAAAACATGIAGGLARSLSAAPESAAQNATTTPLPTTLRITKGLVYGMLPGGLSHADRFKMARDVGFEAMQAPTTPDEHTAEEIKNAADKANIRIDSVMNMDHWDYPLSSSDPVVVEKSLAGMRTSLHNARLWGSDAVLLVPAVVNPQTSYRDAWTRSQTQIRKLIPLAAELRIVIAIEEVWNKFLLSPLEMDRYIRESPTGQRCARRWLIQGTPAALLPSSMAAMRHTCTTWAGEWTGWSSAGFRATRCKLPAAKSHAVSSSRG